MNNTMNIPSILHPDFQSGKIFGNSDEALQSLPLTFSSDLKECFNDHQRVKNNTLDKLERFIKNLLEDEMNGGLSNWHKLILNELRNQLTWEECWGITAEVGVSLAEGFLSVNSGSSRDFIDKKDVKDVLNGDKDIQEVIYDDFESVFERDHSDELTLEWNGEVCEEYGYVRISRTRLKSLKEDPYIRFRDRVLPCLNREDHHKSGYDTLVEQLEHGNPVEVSRWIEKLMNEYQERT